MENNNLDGKNPDPREADNDFDVKFDDELDAAFDELEVHGSGVQKVDPSSRETMPDVDEVNLEEAAQVDEAICTCMTIPPALENYDRLVEVIRTEEGLKAYLSEITDRSDCHTLWWKKCR